MVGATSYRSINRKSSTIMMMSSALQSNDLRFGMAGETSIFFNPAKDSTDPRVLEDSWKLEKDVGLLGIDLW